MHVHTESSVSYASAAAMIEAVTAEARRRGRAVVVAVADAHGELVALARMDGAMFPSIVNAANKAWTAARELKPSGDVGKASRDPRSGFDTGYFGDPRYTGWAGGIPIRLGEAVIGAVAVSGATEDEDTALAGLGLAAAGSSAGTRGSQSDEDRGGRP